MPARPPIPPTVVRASMPWFALLAGIAGAQSPVLHALDGAGPYDQLGFAVAAVGDVDGDGCPDFALGAPFADGNGVDAGQVQVRSGRTGLLLQTVDGASATAQFGSAIDGGADVDGDGTPDLLVGAPGDDSSGQDCGAVFVLSGRTWLPLFTLRGGAGDRLGDAVGFAGDIDGDGTPDFAAGAPLADAPGIDAGRAQVCSGRTGLQLWTGIGLTGDHYGHRILGVGDVDADGRDDFAVSAPWSDQVASKCGSAMVVSGRTFAVLYTWLGTALGHEFGTAIAAPGDVDGDGHAEVAVAAPEDKTFGDDSGSVRLFDGSTGSVRWWWYGNSGYDYFGMSIAAGDFDGDGQRELLVGAPFDEQVGIPANAGILRVFSCVTGALEFQVAGNQTNEQLGRASASLGDGNGDGLADFVAGAPLRDAGSAVDAGGARVCAGQAVLAQTATFGGGCGAPALQLAYGVPARLGQPLSIQLQQGPPGIAIGWLGHQLGGGLPPPVDLAPLGLGGCTQWIRLDVAAPLVLQNGSAAVNLAVPAALAPWGLVLAHQGACLDPAAAGGIALSNGGRAVIGR